MEESRESDVMTIKEFAKVTGFTDWAVRTLINEERICYIKIGRKYYIHYTKSMARLMLESDRAFRIKSVSAA